MVDQSALQLLMPLDEAIIVPQHWINSREWNWRGSDFPPFHVHFSGNGDKKLIVDSLNAIDASGEVEAREKGRSRMQDETHAFWASFASRRGLYL